MADYINDLEMDIAVFHKEAKKQEAAWNREHFLEWFRKDQSVKKEVEEYITAQVKESFKSIIDSDVSHSLGRQVNDALFEVVNKGVEEVFRSSELQGQINSVVQKELNGKLSDSIVETLKASVEQIINERDYDTLLKNTFTEHMSDILYNSTKEALFKVKDKEELDKFLYDNIGYSIRKYVYEHFDSAAANTISPQIDEVYLQEQREIRFEKIWERLTGGEVSFNEWRTQEKSFSDPEFKLCLENALRLGFVYRAYLPQLITWNGLSKLELFWVLQHKKGVRWAKSYLKFIGDPFGNYKTLSAETSSEEWLNVLESILKTIAPLNDLWLAEGIVEKASDVERDA